MKAVFRCDASLEMGTGHVMRCLSLADTLQRHGATCQFISRAHPGHLFDLIASKGYVVHDLAHDTAHAGWLGASQEAEAQACLALLTELRPDWLIVDHYALDASWEVAMHSHCDQLMVIDDLADRDHHCDLLLDQTLDRAPTAYARRVPSGCELLCGAQFAMLRPEFARLRTASLSRREHPGLQHLLVSMGGVDQDNATEDVLRAIEASTLDSRVRVTVVLGPSAPWQSSVMTQAASMTVPTTVRIGVGDMASLMLDSDLAIGAAGATSWERCCLGLPSILIVLADNQRTVAAALHQKRAAISLAKNEHWGRALTETLQAIDNDHAILTNLSLHARAITDGAGCERVFQALQRASTRT